MTWKPDTCDCIIQYNDNTKGQEPTNFSKMLKTCKLHLTSTPKQILEHNQSFNKIYGTKDLTKQQQFNIIQNKLLEKIRIQKL